MKMRRSPEEPPGSDCAGTGRRYRQEPLNDLRQLVQLHRLVELDAVLQRDLAQGTGRDIAGQDDDRDITMKFLPQLRDELEAGHAVG